MSDTVEIDQERYDEFMSILDGILDGIYDNGYEEQVKRLDDLRNVMEQDTTELKSRGTIEFDHMTDEAFEDLVQETLAQSEFIQLDWVDASTAVIYEVVDA